MIYVLPVLFAMASLFFAGLSVKLTIDASKELNSEDKGRMLGSRIEALAACGIFLCVSAVVFNEAIL